MRHIQTQDDQVSLLARLQRADLCFHVQRAGTADSGQFERLPRIQRAWVPSGDFLELGG